MLTVCDSVSVCVLPYPSSQAYQVPEWAVSPAPLDSITPGAVVHGAAEPVSNPGFPSSCVAVQPPPAGFTVQAIAVELLAPVVSVAVTVVVYVPAVVGVP